MAAWVIPWENQYGIAVVFERGNYVAYPVAKSYRLRLTLHLRQLGDVGGDASSSK